MTELGDCLVRLLLENWEGEDIQLHYFQEDENTYILYGRSRGKNCAQVENLLHFARLEKVGGRKVESCFYSSYEACLTVIFAPIRTADDYETDFRVAMVETRYADAIKIYQEMCSLFLRPSPLIEASYVMLKSDY